MKYKNCENQSDEVQNPFAWRNNIDQWCKSSDNNGIYNLLYFTCCLLKCVSTRAVLVSFYLLLGLVSRFRKTPKWQQVSLKLAETGSRYKRFKSNRILKIKICLRVPSLFLFTFWLVACACVCVYYYVCLYLSPLILFLFFCYYIFLAYIIPIFFFFL